MRKKFFLILYAFFSIVLAAGAFFIGRNSQIAIGSVRAGEKVIETVRKYFIQDKRAGVILAGIPVEEKYFYKVELSLDAESQSFYLTKDGQSLVLPNSLIDIAKLQTQAMPPHETGSDVIPRSARPIVELFVMSLCPYGIKAQKEALAVANTFGDTIDFKIKFIVDMNGDSIEAIKSLHGRDEVREDARQNAIMRLYPDRFSGYIAHISENECMFRCGAFKLEEYWKKPAKELRMDVKRIEAYAYAQEGLALLRQDSRDAKKYEVRASPTCVINGTRTNSIFQGRKALKDAICSAFLEPANICKPSSDTGS